jgi:formate hydrogenlyase transcriptional activator
MPKLTGQIALVTGAIVLMFALPPAGAAQSAGGAGNDARFAQSAQYPLLPRALEVALVQYHWPGNVRELQNVIERAVIVSQGSVLRVPTADLKPRPVEKSRAQKAVAASSSSLKETLDETERQRILAALERANWVVAGPNGAAALLQMKRSTLQFRMRKLDIRVSRTGS